MKSCPTCNRTFEDTWTFCLADGSLLSAPFDPQATQRLPGAQVAGPPPTEVMKPGDPNAPPPTRPAGVAEDAAPTLAAPAPPLGEGGRTPADPNHAPARSAQPRGKAVFIWLVSITVIAALAALYFLSGREAASGIDNQAKRGAVSSEGPVAPSPAPSATPAPAQTRSGPDAPPATVPQASASPPPAGEQNGEAQAVARVRAILRRNAAACQISQILSVSARRTAHGWRVTARVVMAASGRPLTETLEWTTNERGEPTPASQLTFEVGQGCF